MVIIAASTKEERTINPAQMSAPMRSSISSSRGWDGEGGVGWGWGHVLRKSKRKRIIIVYRQLLGLLSEFPKALGSLILVDLRNTARTGTC